MKKNGISKTDSHGRCAIKNPLVLGHINGVPSSETIFYVFKKYSEKGFRNKQIKHQYSTDNENLQVQKNCCPDCRWKMEMNGNFKYFA
jgi:hypothetical protein